MKRIIFFSVALLCLIKSSIAQTEIITFPTEGSVFQANNAGVFQITFGGQVKNPNPMFYRIEKRNGNNSWQVIINDATLSTNFSVLTGGIGRGVFSTTYNSNLSKGWYRLSIYRKWNNWFGLNTVRSIKHQVQFGVGDVYFIAGQSNASGYGGSNYHLQGPEDLEFPRDNTVSTIMSNINHSPMARVLNSKLNEQGTPFSLNSPQRIINFAIPYKTGFSEFKNGTNENPSENSNERVAIYPNGYNSWYWAPLAHKIANPTGSHIYSGTPTMWFNVASPSTALQDNGTADINIWNIVPTLNASARSLFLDRPFNQTLMGKFKQTLETYAGPFGAKGVLWHQGETDHEAIMDDNNNVSAADYQNSLTTIINKSREYATGSSSNTSLNWFVAKTTLYAKSASIINSTISSGIAISTLTNKESYKGKGGLTDKLYTSATLRNNQTSSLPNVFEGPNTDDINSTNSEIQRSSHYFVHLSGNSLQKAADDWYPKLNQTSNSLSPTAPLKITQVVKNSATSYSITVDNAIGSTEFVWLVDGYGLNNGVSQSTTNFETFDDVQPNQFLHGYAKKNGRWHAIIPFMVPGGSIETKKLVLSENNLPAPTQGAMLSTKVTAIDTEWEIQSSVPSWMTVTYDQDESTINVNVNANNSSGSRSGVIQLVETGGGLTTSLTVTQSGTTSTSIPLTSLTPTSSSGWYKTNASVSNNTMQVSGVQYFQGFGVQANNSLFFNIGGQYSNFTGKVGRDDGADNSYNSGNVQFTIKGDGATLWTSGIHGNTTNAESFSVNVSGKTTIELYTDITNDFDHFDHGDWMDLFLTTGSGTTCTNSTPTNVYANPTSVSSGGGNSTLYATCSAGTTPTWSTGQTGASVVVYVSSTTNYSVTCVGNSCNPSNPASVTVTVPPSGGCSNITDNLNMGSWNVNGHPLIARQFHNQMWLTQRIGTNPESFLVRGSSMLTRNDISNTSYSSQVGCFAWVANCSECYGGLATPNSTQFPTPSGFTLAYECSEAPCNATNGTPYYTAINTPPPPSCASSVYLNNSWTYASAGYNPPPKIGTNIGGNNMAMGGVNYSSTYPNTGIGTHTTSEIIYDLGSSHPYSHFLATVGKDNSSLCGSQYGQEKLLFKVINNDNGAVLATSPYLGNPNSGLAQTADISASISGVRYLKLVVEDGGDGGACDWANWARARLACSANGRVAATDSTEEIEFMSIVPNPNSGQFDLMIYLEEDSGLEISLMNSNGQIYESTSSRGKKGMNSIPYKTQKVSSGNYVLRVVSNSKTESRILVIE